jgi:predicted transcriptional regulator
MRQRSAQFLLRLDENILDGLRVLAKKEGRTATELLREAVADLLKKREMHKSKKSKFEKGVN